MLSKRLYSCCFALWSARPRVCACLHSVCVCESVCLWDIMGS